MYSDQHPYRPDLLGAGHRAIPRQRTALITEPITKALQDLPQREDRPARTARFLTHHLVHDEDNLGVHTTPVCRGLLDGGAVSFGRMCAPCPNRSKKGLDAPFSE